jgi:hypothetical protein
MGTFTEIAIVDYLLSFDYQAERTSPFPFAANKSKVCHFRFLLAANKWKFMFSVSSITNGKQKPRRFSLIYFPFAHRKNGSLSFVRKLANKQTEVIRLQTD